MNRPRRCLELEASHDLLFVWIHNGSISTFLKISEPCFFVHCEIPYWSKIVGTVLNPTIFNTHQCTLTHIHSLPTCRTVRLDCFQYLQAIRLAILTSIPKHLKSLVIQSVLGLQLSLLSISTSIVPQNTKGFWKSWNLQVNIWN